MYALTYYIYQPEIQYSKGKLHELIYLCISFIFLLNARIWQFFPYNKHICNSQNNRIFIQKENLVAHLSLQ